MKYLQVNLYLDIILNQREQFFFSASQRSRSNSMVPKFGILNSDKKCYLCGSKTVFDKKQNKNRYLNFNCRIWIYLSKYCFHESSLSIRKLILLLYEWSIEISISQAEYV